MLRCRNKRNREVRQREADCDYGDDGFHCFEGMLVVKILLVMQQVEYIHGRDGSSMSKGEKEKIFQVVIVEVLRRY